MMVVFFIARPPSSEFIVFNVEKVIFKEKAAHLHPNLAFLICLYVNTLE